MNDRCNDLDLFFDGELVPSAAEAFRDHLGACEHCQNMLHGRMLEAAILCEAAPDVRASDKAPELPAARVRARRWDNVLQLAARVRRPAFTTVSSFVAAAAAILLLVPRAEPPPEPATVVAHAVDAIPLAAKRGVEVRFAEPRLDHYRPYNVSRNSTDEHNERIDLRVLAAFEQHSELDALVGALALNGDFASARRHAASQLSSAESLTNRAALELIDGRSDDAAIRAVSLASDALRLKPTLAQARWNRAIALERLGLFWAAAKTFDELSEAKDDATGWTAEARQRAMDLRQKPAQIWNPIVDAAKVMQHGGAPMTPAQVEAAPSLARDTLYQALALATTPERVDALAPIATQLDTYYDDDAKPLAALLQRTRAGLPLHVELAPAFAALVAIKRPTAQQLDEVMKHAIARDARDIALASFLAGPEQLTAPQLALLERLTAQSDDRWWRTFADARAGYDAMFVRNDLHEVDAIAKRAGARCRTPHNHWCTRLAIFAGDANSELGRVDLALQQFAVLLKRARDAHEWGDEAKVFHAIGMAQAKRISTELNVAAIGDAFLEETALRTGDCGALRHHFDFVIDAELHSHRFDDAARRFDERNRALAEATCGTANLNGEMVRVHLLMSGRATLKDANAGLAKLEPDNPIDVELAHVLGAVLQLVEDREAGRAALNKLIARIDARLPASRSSEARTIAYEALIDDAARAKDADRVLALLASLIGAPADATCVLGVTAWNRQIVALRDSDGHPALEALPHGELASAEKVVSEDMRQHLTRCAQVHVLATAPYFGAPKLLDPNTAWSYRAGAPRTANPQPRGIELVVDSVAPPADLHLPALRPFRGGPSAITLARSDATPSRVLERMRDAELVVIVAHGATDANESNAVSLVLSPDERGDYLLTASKVTNARLDGAPIVVLAGCDVGRVQVSAAPWSVATAFLSAGARVVIAPTAPIPDDEAAEVFQSLVARIRRGANPITALTAERADAGSASAWLSSIVVFE